MTSVEIIKLRLGNRIVHIKCREQQFAFFLHLIQTVYTGRCLFRYAAHFLSHTMPASLILSQYFFQNGIQFDFILRMHFLVQYGSIILCIITDMNHHGSITTIVYNHVRTFAAGEIQCLQCAPPVVSKILAFPCEYRNTGSSNRSSSMILR